MLKCQLHQLKFSVKCHTELKERHCGENKLWELLYLLNHITWQEAYVESNVNAKFDLFMSVIYIIKTTLLFLPKQYIWRNEEKLDH